MKKATLYILLLLVGLIIGFFIGRSTIDTKEVIKYVKGETITGSVSQLQFVPDKEEKPDHSSLPLKNDTVYLPAQVDTAAIIAEYELKRTYNIELFNNMRYGKLDLFPTIQYNRLIGLDYSYLPFIEQRNRTQAKVWIPFVSATYSTLDFVGVGGGLFYHNIGFEYQYLKGFRNTGNGHSFGLKFKF